MHTRTSEVLVGVVEDPLNEMESMIGVGDERMDSRDDGINRRLVNGIQDTDVASGTTEESGSTTNMKPRLWIWANGILLASSPRLIDSAHKQTHSSSPCDWSLIR